MEAIWGKSLRYLEYSQKGLKVLNELIDSTREEFRQEYKHAIEDYRYTGLYAGSRFKSNEQIAWALQSNVREADFLQEPKHYLFRVLLGACDADYYYSFEKEW